MSKLAMESAGHRLHICEYINGFMAEVEALRCKLQWQWSAYSKTAGLYQTTESKKRLRAWVNPDGQSNSISV